MNTEVFWDVAYGLESLFLKTWKSSHLQMQWLEKDNCCMDNKVSILEMVTDLPGLQYPYPGGSSSLNFHKSLLAFQEQWVESNKQFGAASVVKTGIHIMLV